MESNCTLLQYSLLVGKTKFIKWAYAWTFEV